MVETADVVIIGAGVIGLAAGRAFARNGREVLVLERNKTIGTETSSRNSGVIHAGIYYPKRSLKAKLCVRGKQLLYAFCNEYDVQYKRLGKIIVATSYEELATLEKYQVQALANGVYDLHWLKSETVQCLEPEIRCVAGLLSPSTGIVDSLTFLARLQADLEAYGGTVVLNAPVTKLTATSEICVEVQDIQLKPKLVLNCAGLATSALARSLGIKHKQYFAKGHYFDYSGTNALQHLIYPIATPDGVGIHVTLDFHGGVKFGPDVQWIEKVDYGFDVSRKQHFIPAIQRYLPDLDANALHPSYTGIRTKLVSEGKGFVDFRIRGLKDTGVPGYIEAVGIDSPGLTAALAVGEYLVALACD